MALEPEMPSLEQDSDNPELRDFTRRFWWTLPLSVIVMALAMVGHRLGLMSATSQSWVELLLATPVVLWAGRPFLERGVQSIGHRSPNMFTLIGLGVTAAYVYSLIATIAPGVFPDSFAAHGRIGVYFEAAAIIVSLTLLGQSHQTVVLRERVRVEKWRWKTENRYWFEVGTGKMLKSRQQYCPEVLPITMEVLKPVAEPSSAAA